MKHVVAVAAGLCAAASASAQITMTHSLDPVTIVGGNSVACAATSTVQQTTENSYLRTFIPANFGATGPIQVTKVSISTEAAEHPAGVQDVTLNIYIDTNGGAPASFAELMLVGTAVVQVPDGSLAPVDFDNLAIGPINANDAMVVEIFTPDYTATFPNENAVFFIGSNPFGETDASYIASASCGLPNPATLAAVGFPGMHIIMTVTAEDFTGGCYPDCDGSGGLDLFDFLCFVNEFNNGNTYADCDGSGGLDLFDFLCFVNEFNNGC
jgi:hypothetical protein